MICEVERVVLKLALALTFGVWCEFLDPVHCQWVCHEERSAMYRRLEESSELLQAHADQECLVDLLGETPMQIFVETIQTYCGLSQLQRKVRSWTSSVAIL